MISLRWPPFSPSFASLTSTMVFHSLFSAVPQFLYAMFIAGKASSPSQIYTPSPPPYHLKFVAMFSGNMNMYKFTIRDHYKLKTMFTWLQGYLQLTTYFRSTAMHVSMSHIPLNIHECQSCQLVTRFSGYSCHEVSTKEQLLQ